LLRRAVERSAATIAERRRHMSVGSAISESQFSGPRKTSPRYLYHSDFILQE
jgi:hypothetical protein